MPARLLSQIKKEDWPKDREQKWTLTPDGIDGGKFGRVEHRVIVDENGVPRCDRPVIHEGSHVIICLFGRNANDEIVMGLVKENRDTAAPLDGKTSVAFWGPPRGFRGEDEDPIDAAKRIVKRESGADVCLSVGKIGDFITNETTTSSWSPVIAVEVDLSKIGSFDENRTEKFFGARWCVQSEILSMLWFDLVEGASTNSLVLQSVASMLFWSHCPK